MVLRPRILMLFVDGMGMPACPLEESVYAPFPNLCFLFRNHCRPVDARLGVEGIPQSATGQTSIFTGINAARYMGRHVEGFPPRPLRCLLEKTNLFDHLTQAGLRCAFANAYVRRRGMDLPMVHRSVTTVMTLAALGETRNRDALLSSQAVYHDLTRGNLLRQGVKDVPIISEHDAAEHLVHIMRTVDLCLFEYFLTDHAGHGRSDAPVTEILGSLDRFLGSLLALLDFAREWLILVSDHGNIEDTAHRGHTDNPVPWIVYGDGAGELLERCASILDITPALVEQLTGRCENRVDNVTTGNCGKPAGLGIAALDSARATTRKSTLSCSGGTASPPRM